MSIDTFLADFKANNAKHDAAGIIDDLSIYAWVNQALRKFGSNILVIHDCVVEVKNSKAFLPDNFYSLHRDAIYRCIPKGYYCENPTPVLQSTLMWTERTELNHTWNLCDPSCVQGSEKIITEKVFINDCEVQYYYHNPQKLYVHKSIRRKGYNRKRFGLSEQGECTVMINGQTLHAGFKNGYIYLEYYGLPLDEQGRPEIPDVGRNILQEYVEYFVYMKHYEKVLRNEEDKNVITLFNYYVQKERDMFHSVMRDVKFSTLTPRSFKRLKYLNRAEMLQYEINSPF